MNKIVDAISGINPYFCRAVDENVVVLELLLQRNHSARVHTVKGTTNFNDRQINERIYYLVLESLEAWKVATSHRIHDI